MTKEKKTKPVEREKWEKEFDKRFIIGRKRLPVFRHLIPTLKLFIEREISQARKEARAEALDEAIEAVGEDEVQTESYDPDDVDLELHSRNILRDNIRQRLEELKKK